MPGIEFVTLRRSSYRIGLSHIRFLISRYRFTATVFILVHSDYRPVIYPHHRIQMNHTSVSTFILKMDEPRFSSVGVYPATLMRPVDTRLSLCHYDLRFVRAVNVLRAKYQLPTSCYSTCRSKNIVVSVAFVKFRSFYRMVLSIISVKDHHRIGNYFCSLCIQFANNENTIHSATASGISMYQIYFSVFVPQRSGINHTFPSFHQYRLAPFSFRIFSFNHIDSIIRIPPVNIKFSVMKTNGRCPYAFAMLCLIEERFRLLNR